jgi:hypothetical protein
MWDGRLMGEESQLTHSGGRAMKTFAITTLGAAAAIVLIAGASLAQTLVPPGAGIQLGGQVAGVPDPHSEFRVRLLGGGQPLVGQTIDVLFSGCASVGTDLHPATNQNFPGMTWSCANRKASAVTDANGYATFRLMGGASATPGNSPGLVGACALVVGYGGIVFANVRVGAYDLDGTSGVNAADQSLFMQTLFAGPGGYRTRADYNGDGLCNTADFSKFLGILLLGASATSATPVCF